MGDKRMLSLESDISLLKIREILESVDAFVKAGAAHPQLHDDLALVLAEVLSNIARHGYGHDQGRIHVQLTDADQCMICSVRDFGAPFNPILQDHNAPIPDSLCEGGYGWFLITTLTRDLAYTRDGDQNVLEFTVAGVPIQNTDMQGDPAYHETPENPVPPSV
ncbi:ATP-binding protein [Roseinatronobacter sp.]